MKYTTDWFIDLSIPSIWQILSYFFSRIFPFFALFGHFWRSCLVQAWVAEVSSNLIAKVILTFSIGTLYKAYDLFWNSPLRSVIKFFSGADLPTWSMDVLSVAIIFFFTLWRLYRNPELSKNLKTATEEEIGRAHV